MNKTVILKLAGFIIIPFLVMLAGIFFLYPKLNEDKYDEIVKEFELKQEEQLQSMTSDLPPVNYEPRRYASTEEVAAQNNVVQQSSFANVDSALFQRTDSLVQKDSLYQQLLVKADKNINQLEKNELRLHGVIDSLYAELDRLEMKLDSLENIESDAETVNMEEFAVRIKSLLNLEDDELSPILENLSTDQIVKLYYAGGTIQRQKILRALEAKKAAEIMTEIM
jgi:hypothetical protein